MSRPGPHARSTGGAPLPRRRRAAGHPAVAVAVVALSLLAACGSREDMVTVARVGDEPVVFADFDSFVRAHAGADWMALEEDVLRQLFQQFLDELLLARLAREKGLAPSDADRVTALQDLRQRLSVPPVDGEEVQHYLEDHPETLRRPERLVLGQLLLPDRKTAEEAWREIQARGDFAAVGEEMSGRPGVVYGGYTKDVSRQDLPPAFRDVLFALAPGEVSGIIEADYGFHVFHVLEHRPEEVLPVASASASVTALLEREHADLEIGDMLAEARERFPVEVLDWNLPFSWDVSESTDTDDGR